MDEILNIHKTQKQTVYLNIDSFQTQSDCDKISNIISEHYDSCREFNLVLETKDLNTQNISVRCLYIFSSFLNSLRNQKRQYLKKSIIKIYSDYCYNLLYFMFTYLSSPIAIVEVILYKSNSDELSNIERIKQYFPKN